MTDDGRQLEVWARERISACLTLIEQGKPTTAAEELRDILRLGRQTHLTAASAPDPSVEVWPPAVGYRAALAVAAEQAAATEEEVRIADRRLQAASDERGAAARELIVKQQAAGQAWHRLRDLALNRPKAVATQDATF